MDIPRDETLMVQGQPFRIVKAHIPKSARYAVFWLRWESSPTLVAAPPMASTTLEVIATTAKAREVLNDWMRETLIQAGGHAAKYKLEGRTKEFVFRGLWPMRQDEDLAILSVDKIDTIQMELR